MIKNYLDEGRTIKSAKNQNMRSYLVSLQSQVCLCDRRFGRSFALWFFCAKKFIRLEKELHAITGCAFAIAGWSNCNKMATYFIKKAPYMFWVIHAIVGLPYAIAGMAI